MIAHRRKWSAAEDESLRRAVLTHAPADKSACIWTKISAEVGGNRSTRDCKKRWYYTLDPTLKRGRWSAEEDDSLRRSYHEFGPQWHKIADRITGRTDEQIAKRWRDVLSPDLRPEIPWTNGEDALLQSLYLLQGPKWTLMADSFPGRNGIQCRNRFRRLNNLRLVRKSPSSGPASSDMAMSPVDGGYLTDSHLSSDWLSNHGMPSASSSSLQGGDSTEAGSMPRRADNSNGAPPHVHEGHFQQTSGVPQAHNRSRSWELSVPRSNGCSAFPASLAPDPAWTFNDAGFQAQSSDSALDQSHTTDPDYSTQSSFADWLQNCILGADVSQPLQETSPAGVPQHSDQQSASAPECGFTQEPIRDMYGLCVGLDSGRDSLTLSTDLIRKLVKDAAGR